MQNTACTSALRRSGAARGAGQSRDDRVLVGELDAPSAAPSRSAGPRRRLQPCVAQAIAALQRAAQARIAVPGSASSSSSHSQARRTASRSTMRVVVPPPTRRACQRRKAHQAAQPLTLSSTRSGSGCHGGSGCPGRQHRGDQRARGRPERGQPRRSPARPWRQGTPWSAAVGAASWRTGRRRIQLPVGLAVVEVGGAVLADLVRRRGRSRCIGTAVAGVAHVGQPAASAQRRGCAGSGRACSSAHRRPPSSESPSERAASRCARRAGPPATAHGTTCAASSARCRPARPAGPRPPEPADCPPAPVGVDGDELVERPGGGDAIAGVGDAHRPRRVVSAAVQVVTRRACSNGVWSGMHGGDVRACQRTTARGAASACAVRCALRGRRAATGHSRNSRRAEDFVEEQPGVDPGSAAPARPPAAAAITDCRLFRHGEASTTKPSQRRRQRCPSARPRAAPTSRQRVQREVRQRQRRTLTAPRAPRPPLPAGVQQRDQCEGDDAPHDHTAPTGRAQGDAPRCTDSGDRQASPTAARASSERRSVPPPAPAAAAASGGQHRRRRGRRAPCTASGRPGAAAPSPTAPGRTASA